MRDTAFPEASVMCLVAWFFFFKQVLQRKQVISFQILYKHLWSYGTGRENVCGPGAHFSWGSALWQDRLSYPLSHGSSPVPTGFPTAHQLGRVGWAIFCCPCWGGCDWLPCWSVLECEFQRQRRSYSALCVFSVSRAFLAE